MLDAPRLYSRVRSLARAQSADVASRLSAEGVKVISGTARLAGAHRVVAGDTEIEADAVLIATGAEPRILPGSEPDGERILTWRQLYDLDRLPEELIVVGSGVTGAEFACAFQSLGSQVTLVSSRDRMLPHEDADAAMVVEDVFRRRGMTVLGRSRAQQVVRTGDGVAVTLSDGRTVRGTHCLLTVGMVPNTSGLGLAEAGIAAGRLRIRPGRQGHRGQPRPAYTPPVTALACCRWLRWLECRAGSPCGTPSGEAVKPLRLANVAATIFTEPEIATVGVPEKAVAAAEIPDATVVKLPLATNPRAKMQGFRDGFVKIIARRSSGTVLGGVIVAPRASELILGISLAVERSLSVDHLAHTFAVYPSLSGSLTEAARKLMQPAEGTS